LGQQSGAAAAFAGEVARGALVEEAGADKTTLARLSSLLQEDESEGASLILGEDELAREEADLRAAFARRAQELQAALKAGRTFLGGIEDTLEHRLKAMLTDPLFTAPVWKERPVPRPVAVKALVLSKSQQAQREHMVDTQPAMAVYPVGVPQDAPSTAQPTTPPIVPPTPLAPVAPLTNVTGRVNVEFGNLAHIEAFARRRSRRVRSYDRVKRPTPLVERDIPALDDMPSTAQNGHNPLAPVAPSLWDVLAVQAQAPAHPSHLPSPSPLPSIPRQSGLWE
jgi:hypothetical protein